MGSYTTNLKYSNPDSGECNWDDDWWRNADLSDVVLKALLSSNRIIEGGVPSDVGALTIQIEEGSAVQDVTTVSWPTTQLLVSVAPVGLSPYENWIYINSSGVLVSDTLPPAGNFIPIALVDTDETATLRVVDIRPLQTTAFSPGDEINKIIPGLNITSAYIYDTTIDSDGGIWRWNTQLAAWYNEPLNTATRGSRREHPEVSLIVGYSLGVTIFDATVPGVDMWRVIPSTTLATDSLIGYDGAPVTSVTMKNGVMAVGKIGSNAGWSALYKLSWIDETALCINRDSVTSRRWSGDFVTGEYLSDGTLPHIAGYNVHKVGIVLLPAAPVNPATGLQVPTIAAGNSLGISVLDSLYGLETITDSISTNEITDIFINDLYEIMNTRGLTTNLLRLSEPLTGVTTATFDSAATVLNETSTPALLVGGSPIVCQNAVGTDTGLTIVKDEMVNYITSEYQSGFMHGDVKLGTLASTVEGVLGLDVTTNLWIDPPPSIDPEWTDNGGGSYTADGSQVSSISMYTGAVLTNGQNYTQEITVSGLTAGTVTVYAGSTTAMPPITANGTYMFSGKASGDLVIYVQGNAAFSGTVSLIKANASQNFISDYSFDYGDDWLLDTGVTISGSAVSWDGTQVSVANVAQVNAVPVGKNLFVRFYMSANSAGDIQVVMGGSLGGFVSGVGWHSIALTQTGVETFYLQGSADFIGTIDEVITGEITVPDVSVNNFGLHVAGEITKTAISTGDLVGWGGFTEKNYVEQPFNAGLDFAAEFYFMYWVKQSSLSNYQLHFSRRSAATTGLAVFTNSIGTIAFNGLSTNGDWINTFPIDTWTFVCLVRDAANDMIRYFNGAFDSSSSAPGSTAVNLPLRIGRDSETVGVYPTEGEIALFRAGAGAPDAATILEIYNAERYQFAGFNSSLSGGNAVTALSYDAETNSLKVGNTDGAASNKVDTFIGNVTPVANIVLAPSISISHDRARYALADEDQVIFHKNRT